MATYHAENATVTIDGTEIKEVQSFTLPEITGESQKHKSLKSTSMQVDVSQVKDLGQFQITYDFDPNDSGQSDVRGGINNTEKTIVITLDDNSTITIGGKITSVGGGSSDGLAKIQESATFEVTTAPVFA